MEARQRVFLGLHLCTIHLCKYIVHPHSNQPVLYCGPEVMVVTLVVIAVA